MSDLTTILRIMGMPRCIEAADEIERLTAALAAQPAQALTPKEIDRCIQDWSCSGWCDRLGEIVGICRAVERAVRGQV